MQRCELSWRIEQALYALTDWVGPGKSETRRAASMVQAILLPAIQKREVSAQLGGILQEAVYISTQAEREGNDACTRTRIIELLYLAQDCLAARRA